MHLQKKLKGRLKKGTMKKRFEGKIEKRNNEEKI